VYARPRCGKEFQRSSPASRIAIKGGSKLDISQTPQAGGSGLFLRIFLLACVAPRPTRIQAFTASHVFETSARPNSPSTNLKGRDARHRSRSKAHTQRG
jgi:hypothetical protein